MTRPDTASRRRRTRSTAPAKSSRSAAARPDQVDLPEGKVADAHRGSLARKADDDDAAGLSHEIDSRLHETGDTGRLEHDLRPVPARPLANGGRQVAFRLDVESVGPEGAPVGRGGWRSCRRAAPTRRGRRPPAPAPDRSGRRRGSPHARPPPHDLATRPERRSRLVRRARSGPDRGRRPARRARQGGRAAPAALRPYESPSGRSARTRCHGRCGTGSSARRS